MNLSEIRLRATSPERLAYFYVGTLGMVAREQDDDIHLSYPGKDAALVLQQALTNDLYRHTQDDRYWKIGITVPNVDIAYEQLVAAGVDVSHPRQFLDIGYMCHFVDPEGFVVELLQHHFEGNRPADTGSPDEPLGGGARIGQITLRAKDIAAALAFYRDRIGMRLLSIQPVIARGFTLYFLALTDDQPPGSDLEAVENREWLWQRSYTTLEFQHLQGSDASPGLPIAGGPGFAGLTMSGTASPDTELEDELGGQVRLV